MLTIRISRRVAFLVVLGVFFAIPAGSWASHRFTDVPDSNVFHADIGWLADAGVTLGCNPPANDEFCPDDAVTRAQMSAFMRRFAQHLDAEDGTPGFADTAGDAATLDGLDSTAFLGASAKAVDADKLDGVDSSGFVNASGGGTIVGTIRVQSDGTVIDSWMANGNTPTVAKGSAGIYNITWPGEPVNINSRAAFGNVLGASSGWMTQSSSGGITHIVRTFNTAGVPTDDQFWAFIMND